MVISESNPIVLQTCNISITKLLGPKLIIRLNGIELSLSVPLVSIFVD